MRMPAWSRPSCSTASSGGTSRSAKPCVRCAMYGRTSPTFYSYLFYGDVTAQIRQTPHSRAPYAVYGTSLARSDEFDWRPTNAT